jgi:HSP20 family protein
LGLLGSNPVPFGSVDWRANPEGTKKNESAIKRKCMNALTRWNPFREMEEIQDRLSSWFDPRRSLGNRDESVTFSEWAPLVDIIENHSEYLLKVELPEVSKENVSVTVENGILNIRGERKSESEEKGKTCHRMERYYGSFERSFTIPAGADGSKVTAEFKDGVLRVHLPKDENAKPRTIAVKVA